MNFVKPLTDKLFAVQSDKDLDEEELGFAMRQDPSRKSRWYFGGLASMGAACCTHPLDLIKVHLQTASSATHNAVQQGSTHPKVGIFSTIAKVYRTDGVRGFYSGLTASLLRQASYSTTRFAIYDVSESDSKYNSYNIRITNTHKVRVFVRRFSAIRKS